MMTLIKNEIFKIFHKKGTLIVLILIVLYAFLVNYIYTKNSVNYGYDAGTYYEDFDYYREIVNNHKENQDDYEYFDALARLEARDLTSKYTDWRFIKGYNLFVPIVIDRYTNGKNTTKEYEEAKKALENNNWKYFVKLEKKQYEQEKKQAEETLKIATSKDEKKYANEQKFIAEENIKLLDYRLSEDVCYDSGYLDDAVVSISESLYSVYEYNSGSEAEKENLEWAKKEYEESKYILDKKVDTKNERTMRAVYVNFFEEFSFLILVFSIMIAGGIVSDEFNKGTIKSLLIMPYGRTKILAAKLITALLMIPAVVIFSLAVEFLVGLIFFDLGSLSIPVVIYNTTAHSLEVVGLLKYILLSFVTKMPLVVLLATLAFTASTIINNTAFAIAFTFCGFIGSDLINSLALAYKIKILNYFVTTNWGFEEFLFGGTSSFGNSLTHAIIVCVIYFVIMIIASMIVFKKKDIKNI